MNRKDRRRKLKKASKGNPQSNSEIGQLLTLAVQHHNAGRLVDAERLYRQVLKILPNQPDALFLLGRLSLQGGKHETAVKLLTKATAVNPDNLDAANLLGNALMGIGRVADAVEQYRNITTAKPDAFGVHYNLGNAQMEIGQREEAADSYRKALAVKPDFVEAHCALAKLNVDWGRLDDAVVCYENALGIKSDLFLELSNLASALRLLGREEEALQRLLDALGDHPGNPVLLSALLELLNQFTPPQNIQGPIVEAQRALSKISKPNQGVIGDADIQTLYGTAEKILNDYDLKDVPKHALQIWRGQELGLDCTRHMMVFKRFNAIPEFCFGCFKITIEVRTVIDLMKLLMVFDGFDVPNDNSRKCHVELRPNIPGVYKGLVYCRDFEDAQKLHKILEQRVADQIGADAKVVLKRGCSEFPQAFPEYGKFDDDGLPVMAYDERWREAEASVDQSLKGRKRLDLARDYNHPGLSVRDAMVMRAWLSYAAAIGDDSYRQLTSEPLPTMTLKGRPAFV